MILKVEILNIYRHAKGLFESAERVARAEGVVCCPICRGHHAIGAAHISLVETSAPLIVEHKPKKTNTQ